MSSWFKMNIVYDVIDLVCWWASRHSGSLSRVLHSSAFVLFQCLHGRNTAV
jgi:hypothetical protein